MERGNWLVGFTRLEISNEICACWQPSTNIQFFDNMDLILKWARSTFVECISVGFFLKMKSHARSVKRALTKIGTTTNNHIKTNFSLSLALPQNTVFKVTKMTRRVKNSISNEDYTQLLLHLYLRNEINLMWYSHSEIFLVFPILKLLIQSSDLNSNSCLWQNYLY